MKSRRLQEPSLRYFLEVVRCGSISEASQRLNVAVSAISRQIAGLEDLLGTVLFERRPRGMVPSAAGEILAAHARKAALDADRVVSEILALQGLRSGIVRVASAEGSAVEFLPHTIAEFRRSYPEIVFQLHVSAPADVTRRVSDGDADIGITFSRLPEKGIRIEHRQPSPVVAVMRGDHALAKFKQVTLRQLQAYPLALPEPDTTVRQLFDLCCSRQQLRIEPVLSCNYFPALLSFAAVDGGITIAGEVSVRQRVTRGDVVAIRIRDRGMEGRHIEVQTLIGRTLPHAVQAFLEFLRQRLGAAPNGA
jgi:DNA-binding transcriptional LysR family regulator